MRFLFSCLLISVSGFCYAQSDVLQKPDILPGSPEAAAFAKNVNIPVSYSSGTPQISIPFYSVKSGGMEVPVSISYNASGIRVDETASRVGLGWNLTAAGQINRTIRGNADETPTWGYLNVPYNRTVKYVDSAHCKCDFPNGDPWSSNLELNDIAIYGLDLEPDLFSFSVLGFSGDFLYNQDSGKYILFPYQNISVSGYPGSFTLTLPNGVKAHFGGTGYAETALSGSTASYIDGVSYSPTAMTTLPQDNAWLISMLEEPTGKKIEFTYANEYYVSFGRGGERFGRTISEDFETMRRQSYYVQYIRRPVIAKLSGENIDIYFKRSSDQRQDIPYFSTGAGSLDTIEIKTKDGNELRSFILNYGYFISTLHNGGNALMIGSYAEQARKRLYLKSVTEKRGNASFPPYEFTYNDVELPSRFSTAQDYWGYYNGKAEKSTLLPKMYGVGFYPWAPNYNEDNQILPTYGGYLNPDGPDRRIDTNYSQARVLKKIKYPTGGTTEYYYEQNKASVEQLNIYGGMIPPDAIDKSYSFSVLSNPMPLNPPYPLYYSGIFTIDIPTTSLKITPQLASPCGLYNDPSCKLEVRLRTYPGNNLLMTITTTPFTSIQLSKGQYKIEVLVNGSPDDWPPYFNILCEWSERKDSVNFPVGGLRVKKIVSMDGIGNSISRSFNYNYDSTTKSSGIIEGCPTYKMHDYNSANQLWRRYYVSNSVIPISTDGKTIRYEHVTEYFDSTQSSFKNSYTFTSGLSNPVRFSMSRNGAPGLAWNWQNSLLKSKKIFEKTPTGTYRIISEENNYYQFYKPVIELYGFFGPQLLRYELATEWYLPDSTEMIHYIYEGTQTKLLKSGSKTKYNQFFLPFNQITRNSKHEVIHSKTWYPSDFNNVSGFNISSLLNKHILSSPVKQETSVNGKIISGSIIKYDPNGMPIEGYAYENAVLTDTSLHNRNLILGSNYNLRTSMIYDSDYNLLEIDNYKSGPGAYIWDYQVSGLNQDKVNEVPMAMVQNAGNEEVAYTSFENASKGNWNYNGTPILNPTIMGGKAYSLANGPITKAALSSSKKYIVSYWAASQKTVSNSTSTITGATYNGWAYYEHKVTNPAGGSITVSGSGNIDELRLYPENSQMTTYSYNDLRVINAICDITNRISYFEYDELGRLHLVRDQSGNILKKICYNYSGQQEDCGLGTEAQWQVDSSSCEKISGNYTGNKILRERDTNPNSASYNQTRNVSIQNASDCEVCTTINCTGANKKCINNICETGIKIYTGSVAFKAGWKCYYHYKWSDGSTSITYEEANSSPCTID